MKPQNARIVAEPGSGDVFLFLHPLDEAESHIPYDMRWRASRLTPKLAFNQTSHAD